MVETNQGARGTARVIRASKRLDAAVLEVDGLRARPLPFASAGTLATGDTVMVAGAPMGLSSTFHVGTVSNPRRVILDLCYLQVDARINPGNSGGPAMNDKGEVVGLVSLKLNNAEGLGMALPIDYLYDGEEPLLDPPPSHPTAGFKDMLGQVDGEVAKLRGEREEVGTRLVEARPLLGGKILAVVAAVSDGPPSSVSTFRLENEDRETCRENAQVTWELTPEADDGFARRAREFLVEKGIGDVYVGQTMLSFPDCSMRSNRKLELVLAEGDEKTNRFPL